MFDKNKDAQKEVYLTEQKLLLEKVARLNIDIACLELADPKAVAFKKPIAQDHHGKVTSTQDVLVGEALGNMKKNKATLEVRLEVVSKLLNG